MYGADVVRVDNAEYPLRMWFFGWAVEDCNPGSSGCDAIYHKTFNPPKGDACDACGGELFQRDDDKAEVVAERLVAYHEQTAPVVGWFRERGAVCAVDGNQAPEAVFAACVSCMEEVR